jgi:hypothetical protein
VDFETFLIEVNVFSLGWRGEEQGRGRFTGAATSTLSPASDLTWSSATPREKIVF